jgi:hypothetical protein
MNQKILLGYEIPTAEEVFIEPSHLIVTGITQLSGKTTTLEALLSRSYSPKAVVFRTKKGETSFKDGKPIGLYFRERTDYKFVKSLIEVYAGSPISFEKGTLMDLTEGNLSLSELKKEVERQIDTGKLRGIQLEIFRRLKFNLTDVIEQIGKVDFTYKLSIEKGVNIMNLEDLGPEMQSLIIQSVATEILDHYKGVILVIPEAWKFLPQSKGNPCKAAVESFIRQGATNGNYVWIDSQDMANVDKKFLKQIGTWILGFQRERNEVEHTLDQIPGSKHSKPKAEDIMRLGVGRFYLATREQTKQVYVRPSWMKEKEAKAIARGESKAIPKANTDQEEGPAEKPDKIIDGVTKEEFEAFKSEMAHKHTQVLNYVERCIEELFKATGARANIDTEAIITRIMIALPSTKAAPSVKFIPTNEQIDYKKLAAEVAKLLPKGTGTGETYSLSPLEAIKRAFLIEVKSRIIKDVSGLDPREKKTLLYMESIGRQVSNTEIVEKCLLLKQNGTTSSQVSKIFATLTGLEVAEKQGKLYRATLKKRIVALMGNHKASDQEIDQTYNHILHDIIEK